MSAGQDTPQLQPVASSEAPAAIGPYSQAIRAGGLVFVSGQIPLDPASGTMVGGDIEAQTRQVLLNLGAILTAAGSSMRAVVKTTVYLTDLGDFAAMNRVYEAFVGEPPPARATVQVARLPREARVEIDAIALV
jgi:2-iminobutanoate/2-iminopropanoate deaminase